MRVLMTLHHSFDDDSGASGVTMKIAQALRDNGCSVDLFGFDQAFVKPVRSVLQSARFPLHVASYLYRTAHRYDVVDSSSGDIWVWARLGRPSRAHSKVSIVTRSHGLEHVADERYRAAMGSAGIRVSSKYRLYHGGFRLWEVEQSMRLADRSIVLNGTDYDVAQARLGIPNDRLKIVVHGLRRDSPLFDRVSSSENPIEIAFIGSWIARKGRAAVVAVFEALLRSGRSARLRLLGTAVGAEEVLSCFNRDSRPFITVVSHFKNEELSPLLGDASILLLLSRSEGFSLGLVEGMAAGLVPIATPTGGALDLIVDGENGFLVPVDEGEGDSTLLVERLIELFDSPHRRLEMGIAARAAARRLDSALIVAQTIELYRASAAAR